MNKRSIINKYLEPSLHVIIWSCLFFAIWNTAQTLGPFRKNDGSIYPILLWSEGCNLLLFYITSLYLVPHFIARQRYQAFLISAVLLFITVVAGNTLFDHLYAISLLSSEKEPLTAELTINLESKLVIISLALGYGFSKQRFKEEIDRQQYIKNKLVSELKYLKNQINPHFLFNTLNMAYASSLKNNDLVTADIIEKLSGILRYALYESNEEKVPLEQEIHYVNTYINLQLQRLSDELASRVSYRLEGEWKNYFIAPMMLIPFIENLFKHGIVISNLSPISIMIKMHSTELTLETENASIRKIKNNHSGIGLRNVKERLQLLYPEKHSLTVKDDGETFHIKLTLQL